MEDAGFAGKVQTVLGLVDAETLGLTLPHEHILSDASVYFIEPTDPAEKELAYQPVSLDNLGWIRTNRLHNLDNWQMMDEQTMIKELQLYKQAGGNTIVDMSCNGLGRNSLALARLAKATKLNVIMGTGYYVGPSHPPELLNHSEEGLAREMVQDVMEGVGDTCICCGMIGEIGCSLPLQEGERKVLRASAVAQRQTGAPLSIHPGPGDSTKLEIIDILGNAGADLSHTVICHLDNMDHKLIHKIADAGCYIEFDTFGHLMAPFVHRGRLMEFPSESQRIRSIKQLIDEGYIDHILLSQDIFLKELLTTYGGFGYAYLLNTIVPVMRMKAITDEHIQTLMVENPKSFLTFTSAEDRRSLN